ncbi:PAS domain S-box protein [Brevundimonas sp.]|uniref:PAS domain S-box protein n=1 Tax=Brevundimonas sp. TaxID=1871086 RepID=UPI00289DE952|nr:PAS domain S-box protein [Brevundimonas sp.]
MPSTRHFREIIESAIDFAIIATDRDGVVTDWNSGAERIFGWRRVEMAGNPVDRIFTPEDIASERPRIEMSQSLAEGRANDERWHLRKSGERFWASGELMPLRSDTGEHRGFVKIVRDRTEPHEAGERLRLTEDRFQDLLQTMDSAFAIVEVRFDKDDTPVDYRFVEANPAFERQAGVDLRGKWVTEFAPNLERFWFETYGRVAKTGEPATFENYAEAFQRWFDVRAVKVGAAEDRQIAIFFTDATARREAQARLETSEASARANADRVQLALAAGAIIGTWVWDLRTDQFTVDEGFATSFGLDPALGRSGIRLEQIVATVHPDDRDGLMQAIETAISKGGAYAHQYRVLQADGAYHWIEANGRIDRDADGRPASFPGVLIDVGHRRAIEGERDQAIAALRALNETLERQVAQRSADLMRAEAQLRQSQKMEAVGQLTGGLAHDFNNLLAGVSGALELGAKRLNQGRLTEVEKYLEAAQGAAKRAAALTHRLLAFSRQQTLDPKPTDVNALVQDMMELIQRTVGPAIALRFVQSDALWPALVDSSQLENALLNLCINARDAMPDGGSVTIRSANLSIDEKAAAAQNVEPGEYLTLSVTDTGIGMSPDLISKVFEPFFTTKPLGQGTGLGLSMIYGFTRQSGGQVRIHSTVGEGTTVTLHLPRHCGVAAPQIVEDSPASPVKPAAGEAILIVDDEDTVRMLIRDVMTDLGYLALEAGDSLSGLKMLQSDLKVDLLISDVGLPGGMNGRQMAELARQSRPGLNVLLVTGFAEAAVIGAGDLPEGMTVLTKPFSVEALTARVQQILADR